MPGSVGKNREKSAYSQVLLLLGVLGTVGGGFPVAGGIWMVFSEQPISDSFWGAMLISATVLVCGAVALAYRWKLEREMSQRGQVQ